MWHCGNLGIVGNVQDTSGLLGKLLRRNNTVVRKKCRRVGKWIIIFQSHYSIWHVQRHSHGLIIWCIFAPGRRTCGITIRDTQGPPYHSEDVDDTVYPEIQVEGISSITVGAAETHAETTDTSTHIVLTDASYDPKGTTHSHNACIEIVETAKTTS